MRRRSKAGGEPAKSRRRKTVTLKRRNAPKATRRQSSSAPQTPVARLTRQLQESLAREDATSEVLRVISSSPKDLKPVFDAILENATRICEAKFGNLQLYENGGFRMAAMHNAPPEFTQAVAKRETPYTPGVATPTPMTRVMATKQLVHVRDMSEHSSYKRRDPGVVRLVELAGVRTVLVLPMLKEQELIGIIHIYRQEVRPFTDKQIELVQNFATQAVIAIENTRLLNELRQRTTDLTESLEQQTATSEVLKVISSSPGQLEPVFQTMLRNATRICDARFGSMLLREGDAYRRVALHNAPPKFAEYSKNAPVLRRDAAPSADRAFDTKQTIGRDDGKSRCTDHQVRQGSDACGCANAQRQRGDRSIRDLPPGSSTVQ
jgi:hypothetical protein